MKAGNIHWSVKFMYISCLQQTFKPYLHILYTQNKEIQRLIFTTYEQGNYASIHPERFLNEDKKYQYYG